jgi:hypothetical protein
MISGPNYQLITLTMITLSGFHCILNFYHFKNINFWLEAESIKAKETRILEGKFSIKAFCERLLTHRGIVNECLKATWKKDINISEGKKSFKREILNRYFFYAERKPCNKIFKKWLYTVIAA